VRDVSGDVVARHDVQHPAFILGDVIPIALPAMIRPVFVGLVELLLIVE
jgi:hypothetical protein